MITYSIKYEYPKIVKEIKGTIIINGKEYICVWDTGATSTCISNRLVDDLKLSPDDIDMVIVVGEQRLILSYNIDVQPIQGFVIPNLKVHSANLPADFDVLIGMDVISQGDLTIMNSLGNTSMMFTIER